MGLVNSAMQIGRSALQSYQSALQVTGNNVANVGNPDYTRQTLGLSAVHGTALPEGLQPGAGVVLNELKRNLDEALENRLRAAIGEKESAGAIQDSLGRIETLFDDINGLGISSRLTTFFNSFSDVQNTPADLALRDLVVANGASLADGLQFVRDQLKAIGGDIDGQIGELVERADVLAGQIAELNGEIAAAGAGNNGAAHALLDQRDAVLRELSEIVDVTVRPQPDGGIYVYAGSEPLVMGGVSRGLTAETTLEDGFERTSVEFGDTSGPVPLGAGRLRGLITARDEHAFGRIEAVDEFAAALIFEVNRIHSEGQGLTAFDSVTGTYLVQDTTAALNSADAGLAFVPRNGSFYIAVTDQVSGTVVAEQIEVDLDGIGDDDTTLESLVADINAKVSGVTAEITAGGRLKIDAEAGFAFSFGHDGVDFRDDSSNVLAALGINTFFEGSNASSIAVRGGLAESSSQLAVSMVDLSGDGSNAGRLSALATSASELLAGATVVEGYNRISNAVAQAGAAALDDVEQSDAVLSALQAQKNAISGVNLDEEAIALLKFERAFQGAARYISTVDRLLREMIALVR
ncbi:MAG: flagellar hook-associated protein FlgK [Planctomycetes bacterium]|nr:flagellar hook-associated protein FlgK [Planctomycetota bacterium]